MTEPLFDVVYNGELLAPDREQVIADFAALCKLEPDQARQILASPRRVIKQGVDAKRAEHYRRRLGQIGVLVSVEAQQRDDIESLLTMEPESEPEQAVPAGQSELTGANHSANDSTNDITGAGSDTEPAADPEWRAADMSLEEQSEDRPGATNFAMADDTGRIRRLNFSFSGNGTEFFKIWIVNIFLSIVTLGIYSAWAKVRTLRYFYANTWLNGSSFEYLADPVTILKGRIIAFVLFVGYTLCQQFYPEFSLVLLVVVLIVLPWLIAKSLRFRMRYTAYRNIRFGFDGSVGGAAVAYSLMFVLAMVTLGLIVPYMLYRQSRYRIDNTRFGVDQFSFAAAPRDYYRIYLIAFGVMLLVVLFSGAFSAANPALGVLAMMAGYVLVITYVQVETINLMFDSSQLGDHGFSSSLEIGPYFKLYFINTVMIVLTLGLFYPWAKVRVARYRAEQLQMMAQGSLDHYVAAQEEDTAALGEELGDMFDFDLGL